MNSIYASEFNQDAKQISNNRLDIHSKVIKCHICDSIDDLKSFKNNYVCEDCIAYLKTATLG